MKKYELENKNFAIVLDTYGFRLIDIFEKKDDNTTDYLGSFSPEEVNALIDILIKFIEKIDKAENNPSWRMFKYISEKSNGPDNR